MDYTLAELDSCMFLYLAENVDKPISIYSMWNQLTSKNGYHCSELTIKDKQTYITQFHCLPNVYNNIIKFYKNGIPYLVCTKLERWQFDQDKYVPQTVSQENDSKFCTVDDLVESYLSDQISEIEPEFIKWLIQNNKEEQLRKILDNYSFDKEEYELYLREAKDKASMVAMLLKHKYKEKITTLMTEKNNLKSRNTYLEQDNVRLTRKTNQYVNDAIWYKFMLQLSVPAYFVITYAFQSYVC